MNGPEYIDGTTVVDELGFQLRLNHTLDYGPANVSQVCKRQKKRMSLQTI